MKLNGRLSLVLVAHQIGHPGHVIPNVLAHGDLDGLAPPVSWPIDIDGADSEAGARQVQEDPQGLLGVVPDCPHAGKPPKPSHLGFTREKLGGRLDRGFNEHGEGSKVRSKVPSPAGVVPNTQLSPGAP